MSRTSSSSSSLTGSISRRLLERWTPRLLVGAILLSPLAAAAQGGAGAKPATSASAKTSASAAPTPSASATATTATTASGAPTTIATGTAGSMDGATYAVRLRDLEQR